jgi:DNA/RNA endonuclease G (NUC1)
MRKHFAFIRSSFVLLLLSGALSSVGQVTTLIEHSFYNITFYTKLCSPIMGYYVQTAEHAANTAHVPRGSFRNDDKAPAACRMDYKTEYKTYNTTHADLQHRMDEGHINPYNAFSFSPDAAKETMLFDNVCPQISHVNEQEWNKVEAEVMKRSKAYGDVKVWTGVLISISHPKRMGVVPIPDFYWKVISYKNNGAEQKEAWLSKNDPSNTHTVARQAVNTPSHVLTVIHQYYPSFQPGF